MRKFFVYGALITLWTASGQSLYMRQTLLDKVTTSAADIDDDAVLKRTLYAPMRPDELSADQCDLMVAAAERRVKRIEDKIAESQTLIDQGILARNELRPLQEELDFRKTTLSLASSRARFIRELADAARLEASFEAYQLDNGLKPIQERFEGKAPFGPLAWKKVALAFQEQFGKPLPVSANGETAFHKALGYDHRGRVDVALAPDQPEGQWLRQYLEKEQIPYYAFRGAVAGRASAAHIHIGPPSTRLRVAD